MTTLAHCQELDAKDALRTLKDQFSLPPNVIYLDGNSLGVLPKATAARIAGVVTQEWGIGLIRSWNTAGWFESPQKTGNKIARLIGANTGEVVATDTTSINLYKVLSAALNIAAADAPTRKLIVSERSNFPTDLYIAEALCQERGYTLNLVAPDEVAASLTADVAILTIQHEDRVDQIVRGDSVFTHQVAGKRISAQATGAIARESGRLGHVELLTFKINFVGDLLVFCRLYAGFSRHHTHITNDTFLAHFD